MSTVSDSYNYLQENQRPSIMLKPYLKYIFDITSGCYWEASFGDLRAKGNSPDSAYKAFDDAWYIEVKQV